jgi:chromosome segregation ATPase
VQDLARERHAAEQARIEVAQNRHRLEAQAEKLTEQGQEMEHLRAALNRDSKARVDAEQVAAVLAAKLEAMTERATKAEARIEQTEQYSQQQAQEAAELRGRLAALTSGFE